MLKKESVNLDYVDAMTLESISWYGLRYFFTGIVLVHDNITSKKSKIKYVYEYGDEYFENKNDEFIPKRKTDFYAENLMIILADKYFSPNRVLMTNDQK